MRAQKVVISRTSVMAPADQSAYNKVRAVYDPFYAKLDDDAKRALNAYGSGKSWQYNEHLRNTNGNPTGDHKEFDAALRRALDCVLPFDLVVYRGHRGQHEMRTKETYVERQPLSTTLSTGVAIDFGSQGVDVYMSVIEAKRGVKFGIPQHDFEAEFLFKQDTVFKPLRSQTVEHGARIFHTANVRAIRTLR